jgi:hypothetical protein
LLQPNKKIVGVLLVVAIGQVIGWGTIGLLAVVGRQVAADLHMDISAVFAGNSTFYVVTGLCAPGSNALLGLAMLCSGAALLMLYWLSRHRPTGPEPGAYKH